MEQEGLPLERPNPKEIRARTPASPPALRIHLLGRFEVLRDGVPVPPQSWRRRRPADLLKLVALSPAHRIARDLAIDTLWPDKDPDAGANNLHRALYDLRLVLGGRHVDVVGAQVLLTPGSWVDVDAFEAAVAAGEPEARRMAVALYRGDLAPEDPESAWLQTRRRLLRSRFAEVAGAVAHEAAERGDAAEAVAILRRLIAADPANEEGHRLLMELLAALGNRAEAVRQYDDASRALRAAGRGLPGEPLRKLRDAIERREVGPTVTPAPADAVRRASLRLLGSAELSPLRGRAAQLLSADGLAESEAGVLVVLGEAGVGKTRFALELARLAQERGAAVLAGAACTLYPAAPFAPFTDAFAGEARENPAAPPDPFALDAAASTLPPDLARHRLFGAVAGALVAAGRGRPVFLVLDDLHAADESSLNLLHALALRAGSLRLTVVATCEENAVRAGTPIQMALTHLDTDKLARGLRLPRLAFSPSAERLADVLAAPPAPAPLARICQVTDGNPFELEQVALAWEEAGRGEVPRDAAAALRARLARLEPGARQLLAGAAVVGDRFSLELAAHAAGLSREQSFAALAVAVEARLLAEGSVEPRFAHARVREEVIAELDPSRRAALHRVVAEALEVEEGRPGRGVGRSDELAWHWREAFDPVRAFRHLVAAGHRAADRSGLREAIGFHEAALDLVALHGVGVGEDRLELLDAVGRARLGLGELEGAVDALRAAAGAQGEEGWRPAPELRARARRIAAIALTVSGDQAAAHREIDLGLSEAAGTGGEEQSALLSLRARLHWHGGRFDVALAAAEWAGAEAERSGQADLVARAADLAGLARGGAGTAPALPLQQGGPVERRHGDPLSDPSIDLPLVLWDAASVGDLPAAVLLRMAGLELARCRERGDLHAAATPLFATGATLLATGEFERAEGPLAEALALFRQADHALGEALTLERLGALHDARGRTFEAMEALADGVVVAERAPLRRHLLVRLLVTQAQNRLAAGSLRSAEVIAREAADCAVRHGVCSVCESALRPLTVRIAIAREALDDAGIEASILESVATSRGGRGLRATALLTRARLEAALGRKERALALLAEARGTFESLGRRYDLALCARSMERLGSPRDPALDALLPLDGALLE